MRLTSRSDGCTSIKQEIVAYSNFKILTGHGNFSVCKQELMMGLTEQRNCMAGLVGVFNKGNSLTKK